MKPNPLLKKPAPVTVLPYAGEISAATRIAIIRYAAPSIPGDVVKRLIKATADIHRLNGAHSALSFDAVRKVHGAARESAIEQILNGAEPSGQFKHLDTLGREFSANRDAIHAAKARAFAGCLDDLERVGAVLESAVSSLSAKIEKQEREEAEVFHVAFTPSPQLQMIQSVVLLIKRRFEGIREVTANQSANMGSPASLLIDLLPGVADW